MAIDFWALGALGAFAMLLIFALGALLFVFWVAMLIDCIKRKFKNDNDRIIWVLVIIFAGLLGATIYYFAVKRGK